MTKKQDPTTKVRAKCGPKPKFIITPDILKEIEILASRHLTQEQMYQYFGIGHDLWYRRIRENPEIETIIKGGVAKRYSFVVSKLMELINEKHPSTIMFYLKTQHGWVEKANPDISDTNKSSVPINLNVNITDPIEAAKIYQSVMNRS
jgi:hypothetical protein